MLNLTFSITRFSRTFYFVSALCYMGCIYILSSIKIHMPDSSYPIFLSFCANLFHSPHYAGLGVLLNLSLRTHDPSSLPTLTLKSIIISLLVLIAYGAFDEYHQSWTGRTPSIMDLCSDISGGIFAVLILKHFIDNSPTRRVFIFLFILLCVMSFICAYCANKI